MRESNFASEIRKSCIEQGLYYYKIPDAYQEERFVPKKPFDIFLINNGTFFGIELKLVKQKRLPFNIIKEHQEKGLLSINKHKGCLGLICINFRWKNYNKAYLLHIADYLVLKGLHLSENKKSIKLENVQKYFVEAERIKGSSGKIWDMQTSTSKCRYEYLSGSVIGTLSEMAEHNKGW